MEETNICPDCGKVTTEKGSCKECLPYNLYAEEDVQALVTFDEMKKFVIDNLKTLRRVDFHEAQRVIDSGSRAVGAIKVILTTGRGIFMVPHIDTAGYESFWFVRDHNVHDGMHRVSLN